MVTFYSTIKIHIHCPSFATLVLMFKLFVTRWHSFLQPYYTENTHNLALDRIITITVFGDTIGKGFFSHNKPARKQHILGKKIIIPTGQYFRKYVF